MAIVGQVLPTPEAGWKRIDDINSSIKYTGTGWLRVANDANTYAGTGTYTTLSGATSNSIRFSFYGTKIRIIDLYWTNRVNNVNISIDGVISTWNPNNSTNLYKMLVFESLNLPLATHEVVITTNSTSGIFSIDAIDIDSDGRLIHPDEVTDPNDLVVGKRIRCNYKAKATGEPGAYSSLGKQTADFIPVANASIPDGDFYFIMVEDHNGKKQLIADRNLQVSISWNTLNANGLVFGLPLNYDLQTPFITDWFPFDDDGNTLTNKVGYYNGTVVGTEIVDGYNGVGKARSFNGISDFITFTNPILPLGKKSIRFKIKTGVVTSSPSTILGSGAYATNNHGLRVGIEGDKLYLYSTYGSSGNTRIQLWSNKVVTDDQWHDVLITWDGTTNANGVKLFIDDMTVPDQVGTARTTETTNQSSNFVIGRRPQGNDRYYTGLIDNLEIYSDVIDPSNGLHDGTPAFSSTVRLLSGGISSTDKDNDWDKYIVNSTLNNTITAGDNNVWNVIGLNSWTSTTPSGTPANRVGRGRTSVASWEILATTSASTTVGFRPMMIIEIPAVIKSFIYSNGEYKKWIEGNKEVKSSYTDDLIPKMISNNSPSGVVRASSTYSTVSPYLAFDDSNTLESSAWITNSTKTGWLEYEFDSPKIVTKYTLESQKYSGGSTVAELKARTPKDWTFEGSNDGATWEILDTQTGVSVWVDGVKNTFSIVNKQSYRKYRINITDNNGSTFTAIGEFEMLGTIPAVSATPSYWKTISTTLPNEDTFISEGMDDLSLLDRKPKKVEQTMIGGSVLGSGRMFRSTIDLKKYVDTKEINVKK